MTFKHIHTIPATDNAGFTIPTNKIKYLGGSQREISVLTTDDCLSSWQIAIIIQSIKQTVETACRKTF